MSENENLENVIEFIVTNNLIEPGDRVGVGVSGGTDSMALLHFMKSAGQVMDFEIVAVNVNHSMRPNSRKDSLFVSRYCKAAGIKYAGYKADVPAFAKEQKLGLEQAARIKRYECFEVAVKRFKLNKFAVAHHMGDQAETILLHIFRGSGLAGARGMDAKRGIYIRPFLETPKSELVAYNYRNQIPHVDDESNDDDGFARNFIRNQIIPALQREWRSVETNIVGFGRNCKSDDEYLNSLVNMNALISEGNNVRIPLNFFAYHDAVISRIVIAAFEKLRAKENIEKKHVDLILELARSGQNGSSISLPNNMFAVREYEYIAVAKKSEAAAVRSYSFKTGRTIFPEFGTVIVTKTISHKDALSRGLMVVDADKLPKSAKWRTRRDGDSFTKFGGGTKALAAWMIDKKIPSRMRNRVPLLAVGSDVLVVAGQEISDKVRTDRETIEAFVLEFVKD